MKVILGFLLSFALLGLASAPAGAATTGSIRGQAIDATGVPVPGVQVSLLSTGATYRTTTDSRGFYVIVGVLPGTYTLAFESGQFTTPHSRIVEITQDATIVQDARLTKAKVTPATIATVYSRNSTFPVQRSEARDVTVINSLQLEQLGGVPAYENGGQLLNMLPGVTPVGGAAGSLSGNPTIRGGLQNEAGFQLDGINALDPLTNEPINSLIINGAQNFVLTAGPGDASQGGSGSGYVNIVTKVGTFPSSGFLQIEDGGPAFEHNLQFEYGTATPNRRYSLFVSGRYDRDFGGCCAPPYGNVSGSPTGAYPDTLGQVNFTSNNDTVVNGLIHFGRNDANTLQLWGEWGSHYVAGGYGITPSQYPYTTNTPAYVNIYQQAPLLISGGALPPLTPAQAQALMPFYPGQTSATQNLAGPPNEVDNFDLMKIGWSRAVGSNGFINARVYRTQNWNVDESNDANDPLFGYGLPSVGFGDLYVTRATQNTGIASDYQLALGDHHEISAVSTTAIRASTSTASYPRHRCSSQARRSPIFFRATRS